MIPILRDLEIYDKSEGTENSFVKPVEVHSNVDPEDVVVDIPEGTNDNSEIDDLRHQLEELKTLLNNVSTTNTDTNTNEEE